MNEIVDPGTGWTVRSFDEIDSTSDELLRWAAAGAPEGATVIASRQTAGRGRQGRRWQSAVVGNLYVSFLLRPDMGPDRFAPLSLVVALVVAEEIDLRLRGARTGLKWPNDVWVDGRKVAGILLEARKIGAESVLVVGVGLNLRTPGEGWRDLRGKAVALDRFGPVEEPQTWLAALLPRWQAAVLRYEAEGLGPFLEGWRVRCVLRGREVFFREGRYRHRARVIGVGDDGSLTVEVAGLGVRSLFSGEVHLEEIGR